MSEPAKHAPGPWHVYPTEFDDGSEAFDVMCDGAAITIACPPTEADAHLIAAAPDLLAACKALLPIVVDAIMHGMPITQAVADARNMAVVAIAKAKGA